MAATIAPTNIVVSSVSDGPIPPLATTTLPSTPPPASTTPVTPVHDSSSPRRPWLDKPCRTSVKNCCIDEPSTFEVSTKAPDIQYETLTKIAPMIKRGSIDLMP